MQALLMGHIIKKIDDVSAESIFGPPAFIEIKRAYRIDFQLLRIRNRSAKLALKFKRALPHLRHGESYNVVWHKLKLRMTEHGAVCPATLNKWDGTEAGQ
jgi:hypothetical protein